MVLEYYRYIARREINTPGISAEHELVTAFWRNPGCAIFIEAITADGIECAQARHESVLKRLKSASTLPRTSLNQPHDLKPQSRVVLRSYCSSTTRSSRYLIKRITPVSGLHKTLHKTLHKASHYINT